MNRYALVVVISLCCVSSVVFAAPIQLIEGLPSTYTPGQPVTFQVRLPSVTDLGSYNIDLVVEGNSGIAGVDYSFDVAATMPSATSYIFPSATNFFDAANVDSPMRQRITLSDFDFAGVDIVPGTNDLVANVVVNTAANFLGSLSLFADPNGLILDTPDVEPTPVLEYQSIHAGVADSPPFVLPPVPEPSCALIAGLAIVNALLLSQRTTRVQK